MNMFLSITLSLIVGLVVGVLFAFYIFTLPTMKQTYVEPSHHTIELDKPTAKSLSPIVPRE